MKARGWQNTRDPQEVIRLAKERLASSDWNQVRPALSVTIRYVCPIVPRFPLHLSYLYSAWLMRGFMGIFVGDPVEEANGWYERVISLLEMGRREWPKVGTKLRGATFVDTFLRGVRRLHMTLHLKVCSPHIPRDFLS